MHPAGGVVPRPVRLSDDWPRSDRTGSRADSTIAPAWAIAYTRLGREDRQGAGEYLRKGSQAYIEGRIRTRKWTDKDGQERYSTEIVGDRLLSAIASAQSLYLALATRDCG